jgi:prepilin-type N-terminal cleavage/methylation domain-containing protein
MPTPAPSRAFTLLELLAVIAVLGVLISILLPALSQVRASARFTGSLANQRTIIQTLSIYTQDHNDSHPYLLASELAHLDRPPAPMGPQGGLSPSAHEWHWMMAVNRHSPDVLPLLYPDLGHFQWQKERDEERAVITGAFFPTATLFAAPAYFSDTTPPQWSHLRPTRAQEIAYPSAKMLVYDWSSVWLNSERDIEDWTRTRVTYAFADASAAVFREGQLTGTSVSRSTVYHSGPGFTTTQGLAGRDR